MFDTIYLHAGLPKTGSTHLQNGLQFLSKARLLRRVAYPLASPELGPGNGSRTADVILSQNPGAFSRAGVEACVQEILRVNDSGAPDLLLSSEHFFFSSVTGFNCLREILMRHCRSLKLIVSARPLGEWIHSIYMQMTKAHALAAPFDEAWMNGFADTFMPFFQNVDAFGVDGIVYPYRKSALLQLFLGLVGEDAALGAHVPDVNVNRSLSADELEVITSVNAIFQDEPLSRMISGSFIRSQPDLQSAGFPALAQPDLQRFASAFSRRLEPLRGNLLARVREILFSAPESTIPGSVRDHDPRSQAELYGFALAAIKQLLDKYEQDGRIYDFLKHYSRGMQAAKDGFDPVHYLLLHPDLCLARIDPHFHYRQHGRAEGRTTTLKPFDGKGPG